MNDKMKLYHKMYPEWYPNSMLLKGFSNLLTAYMPHRRGKIIDIGCGPNSCYILVLLKSDFELYAEDIDPTLIEYLKERILQSNEKVE